MSKLIIAKSLGILFVLIGFVQLISEIKDIAWSLFDLSHPNHFMKIPDYILLGPVSLICHFVIPIVTIISGYGIFKIKKWGWLSGIIICAVILLKNIPGIIYSFFVIIKTRNLPIPKFHEGAHIIVVRLWPTFIYTSVSAVLIFLLTRNSVREVFKKRV